MSERKPGLGNEAEARGHEPENLRAGKAFVAALGLFGVIAVALLLSWGTYALSRSLSPNPGAQPATFTRPDVLPPEPRLQSDPHADLLRLRVAEDSVLGTYGWVNKDSGIVRIPIARAMQLLVDRGLPARDGKEKSPAMDRSQSAEQPPPVERNNETP